MSQILCAYAHSESVQFSLERALNALFEPSEVKVGIELALDPKFVVNMGEIYYGRSKSYKATGQNARAKADYDKAVELDPKLRDRK